MSLAAAYARKQHDMMEAVHAGAERIYAFAYTYCRIQSDPAFPKLIHRLLMDQDLDVITPLAEGIFQQQFIELRASVTLIVGEAKADFATYSIFAAGFGLIRLAPISAYIAGLGAAMDNPQAIAQGTLSLVFPNMDWEPISAALLDRLEAAYSP